MPEKTLRQSGLKDCNGFTRIRNGQKKTPYHY